MQNLEPLRHARNARVLMDLVARQGQSQLVFEDARNRSCYPWSCGIARLEPWRGTDAIVQLESRLRRLRAARGFGQHRHDPDRRKSAFLTDIGMRVSHPRPPVGPR